ncbi:copper resistance protein B [Altererythrobacter sp.]|uniref:copper resistance protein B n=1 Tax=Altererythrobacter sp. TaxID=1872480 RepID=UPI003D070896
MKALLATGLTIATLFSSPALAQDIEAEVDLFEMQFDGGDDAFVFDSTLAIGNGVDGVALKVEGGSEAGPDLDEIGAQLLYTRTIGARTTLLMGVRRDFLPGDDINYATVAVEHSVGDIVELESYFYLSEHGDLTATAQALVAAPLTQSLTFEPRFEVAWAAQDIVEEDIASGLTGISVSARLRQAIGPILNVYGGVIHERLVGDTRSIARAAGESWNISSFIIGAGMAF